METFACWYGLQLYLETHAYVYYKAPLDLRPVPVVCIKRFKNGKLRIQYHDVKFTADPRHLDRFFWRND